MTPFIYKTQEFNWIPSLQIVTKKFTILPKKASTITFQLVIFGYEIGFIKWY